MGLFDLFSGKAGRQAGMFQAQQIQSGADQANAALDKGYDDAKTQYDKADSTLGNLADSYKSGSTMYQNALGLNGSTGTAAARSAYTTSPGYQFNMDQGLQALDRTHAVAGTSASGGADTDAMRFASGLASQDYNNWLGNLSNLDSKRGSAVGAQAGVETGLGNIGAQIGGSKANVDYQSAAAIGKAGADALKAGQEASARSLGALLGVANLGAKGLGSLFGGGLGGGAFSIFGGGGSTLGSLLGGGSDDLGGDGDPSDWSL